LSLFFYSKGKKSFGKDQSDDAFLLITKIVMRLVTIVARNFKKKKKNSI